MSLSLLSFSSLIFFCMASTSSLTLLLKLLISSYRPRIFWIFSRSSILMISFS